ncbi:hypothetical protein [Streptomyces sp. NPDC048521]|uniref:hypothetical protein n=1 Tax=Streptomyces sp. NPDC048521 TaxID=3365566 RepID=UPI003718275A
MTRWASDRRATVPVRPGGYAAWVADTATPAEIETAVARHLGPENRFRESAA